MGHRLPLPPRLDPLHPRFERGGDGARIACLHRRPSTGSSPLRCGMAGTGGGNRQVRRPTQSPQTGTPPTAGSRTRPATRRFRRTASPRHHRGAGRPRGPRPSATPPGVTELAAQAPGFSFSRGVRRVAQAGVLWYIPPSSLATERGGLRREDLRRAKAFEASSLGLARRPSGRGLRSRSCGRRQVPDVAPSQQASAKLGSNGRAAARNVGSCIAICAIMEDSRRVEQGQNPSAQGTNPRLSRPVSPNPADRGAGRSSDESRRGRSGRRGADGPCVPVGGASRPWRSTMGPPHHTGTWG